MKLFKKICKGIGVFFIFIIMLGVVISTFSNKTSDEGKNDANISREELLEQNKDKAVQGNSNTDKYSDSDNDENLITINIDDYFRNIDNYIGKRVQVSGYWSDGEIHSYEDFDNKVFKLNMEKESMKKLQSELVTGQYIIVEGVCKEKSDQLSIDTDNVKYFNSVEKESYWNGSTIITNDTIGNAMYEADRNTEFEFTGIVLSGGYADRDVMIDKIGLTLDIVIGMPEEIPTGSVVKVLVKDMHHDEYENKITASVIDYKLVYSFKGDQNE